MAAQSQTYLGGHQAILVPQKFILITIQIILLLVILDLKQNFIYWIGINQIHSKTDSSALETSQY
mgnify:FL=1